MKLKNVLIVVKDIDRSKQFITICSGWISSLIMTEI